MSDRPADLLLADILDACERIERYIADLDHDEFCADEKTEDAVVRNLEIIGEAAGRLPRTVKSNHPEVEWNKIVGLRNRIVHAYFGIDLEIIWEILKSDLPAFRSTVETIMQNPPTAHG